MFTESGNEHASGLDRPLSDQTFPLRAYEWMTSASEPNCPLWPSKFDVEPLQRNNLRAESFEKNHDFPRSDIEDGTLGTKGL